MFEDVCEVFMMFVSIRKRTYMVVDLAGWSPDITPPSRRSVPMHETSAVRSKTHSSEGQGTDVFRSIGVHLVECRNQLGGFQIVLCDPGVLLMSIPLPSDQILQLPMPQPTVHHLLYLIPLLSSYNLRWWWQSCASIFNWVSQNWHEFDDVEDRVDL
jgi:hypothetical protein